MVTDNRIICPYCDLVFKDSHLFNAHNGKGIVCNTCKKVFMLNVEMVVEYTTKSDCELNNEIHDWQESTWITSSTMVFYHCTKCDIGKTEDR